MAPKSWKKPGAGDAPAATLTTPAATTSGLGGLGSLRDVASALLAQEKGGTSPLPSPKPKAKAWGKSKASPESSAAASGSAAAPKAKAWGKKKTEEDSGTAAPKAKSWGKAKKEEPAEKEQPQQVASVSAEAAESALRRAEEAETELAATKLKLKDAESVASEYSVLKSKLEEANELAGRMKESELAQNKNYQSELVCIGDCKAQMRMEKEVESEAMKKVAAFVAKEHDSHVSELKAQLQAEQWRLQSVELEAGVQRLSSQIVKLESAENESRQAADNSERLIAELRSEIEMDRMAYAEERACWLGKGVTPSTSASVVETLAANLNQRLDEKSLLLFKTDPRFWK